MKKLSSTHAYFIPIFLFTMILCFYTSCKDIENVGNSDVLYEGEFAVALFTSKIKMEDITKNIDASAESSYFDEDGLLHLVYKGDPVVRTSEDVFVNIPNLDFPTIDTFNSIPYPTPPGLRVDLITLKGATVPYQCESNFSEEVSLLIELPQVRHPQTNQIYTHSTNLAAMTNNTPSVASGTLELTGWNLIPEDGKLHFRYIALLPNGTRVRLSNFSMSFNNFKASYIQGYLGLETYDIPRDTISIDFFKQWIAGGVVFENPTISLYVENSIGVPVKASFQVANVVNVDGSTFTLESEVVTNGLDINYPTLNEIGQVKVTNYSFSGTNSNVGNILSQKPILIDYDVDAVGNPNEDESITGFATDSSYFKILPSADFPMKAKLEWLTLKAEVDANVRNDYEFAESIQLKVVSDNNIPLDAALQMYFKDGNGIVLDSLYDATLEQIRTDKVLIKSAGVDAQGNANSTTHYEAYIDIPKSKFQAISKMKKLEIFTIFNNPNNQFSRFSKNDDVFIKVGMKAKIKH